MPEIVVGRDDDDLKKYGKEGTIFIGKHIVGIGEDAHLTTPVILDVLRPHVITVAGKRGSGKSHSMGTIVEEMTKLPPHIKRNLCSLMIDTQGIFWTMKYQNEKDSALLSQWNIKPSGFDVNVYIPAGQEGIYAKSGVEYDGTFSVAPPELAAEDWIAVFGLAPESILSILLQKTLQSMAGGYTIEDVIEKVRLAKGFETEKLQLESYFLAAKSWGIFGESRMPSVLVAGKTSILDISLTPQNVRSLLLSLALKKMFMERVAARRQEELAETEGGHMRRVPLCWIFIDEAHNFLPDAGITPALDILLKLVKEGRQPGITLVLATQMPQKLHPDALAQTDMIISHRLTAKRDIDALNSIMQTYMLYDVGKYIQELPNAKGTAIILDDNSERIYKIRMRPRQSWHAGSSPVAV